MCSDTALSFISRMLNGFQIRGAEERSEKHVSQMIGCVGEYTADVNMMSAET